MTSDKATSVMAFDYGTKRIGVAVGQTASRTAKALKALAAIHGNPQWHQVARLVDEWAPDVFVVGMPTYDDRRPHPLRGEIERFARRLSGRYKLPVEFVDERLSSFEAAHDTLAVGAPINAAAARSILLTWLERAPAPAMAGDQ